LKRVYPAHVTACDSAPSVYADLVNTPNLVVYAGASDMTVYGDSSDNHRFRAWHDSLHIAHGLTFSDIDEYQVGREHARLFGQYSDFAADMVYADVVRQVDYYRANGAFPVNQIAFIESCVRSR
jgi:hypothetical protein